MSVGFRPPEPPPPPREAVVWNLEKLGKSGLPRTARGAIRMWPHGAGLRIYVEGSLVASFLHRDAELNGLKARSKEQLTALLDLGWTRVTF